MKTPFKRLLPVVLASLWGVAAVAQPKQLPGRANAGVLRTLAGVLPNGSPGSADGPGPQARFNEPQGLALAPDGTLYVADTKNETIRKISPTGVVSTLAGKAKAKGYADGVGEQARFNQPVGVAVDAVGTVYVADQQNHVVREIAPDGTVRTLAGTPTRTYHPHADADQLPLEKPTGIALGPGGDLYVTDEAAGCIYRIKLGTGMITTWLSREHYLATASQAPRFRGYSLVSVVFDAEDNGYVGDSQGAIRKVSPTGEVSNWIGTPGEGGFADGTGAAAQLGSPVGLALAPNGSLYVADECFAIIRRVSPAGQVTTVSGTGDQPGSLDGPVATARFCYPHGLAVGANGTLFVADELSSTIRRISPQGQVSTWAGAPLRLGGDDGPGTTAQFRGPEAVAVDEASNVYVADGGGEAIRKIAPDGRVSTLYGGMDRPSAPARAVYLHHPTGVAVAPSGMVYVAEAEVNVIYQITPQGAISLLAGRAASEGGAVDGAPTVARFDYPSALAVGPGGILYVVDQNNALVRKITPQGFVTTLVGKLPTYMSPRDPLLGNPNGIAVDASGTVYVSDGAGHVVRRITPAGVVSVWVGTPGQAGRADGQGLAARFETPAGLSLDRQGNLYVADSRSNTVRYVSPTGLVTTLVGAPTQASSADNPDPTTRLSQPMSVAVGPDGAVYVADWVNSVIRVVR